MAQSFNIPGKVDLSKGSLTKFGPAAGSAVALFGFLLTGLGFLLPWIKVSDTTISGLDVLTKTGNGGIKESLAMMARGSSFNALICNIPFFLCGAFIISLLVIASVFARKFPSQIKLYGPIALGLFGLFSCCPSLLFFIDLQNKMWLQTSIRFGFYIAAFGMVITLLGGIVGIASAIAGGDLLNRKRR